MSSARPPTAPVAAGTTVPLTIPLTLPSIRGFRRRREILRCTRDAAYRRTDLRRGFARRRRTRVATTARRDDARRRRRRLGDAARAPRLAAQYRRRPAGMRPLRDLRRLTRRGLINSSSDILLTPS